MFCIHCGQKLPDNARFCLNCGQETVSTPEASYEADNLQEAESSPHVSPESENTDNHQNQFSSKLKAIWINKKTRYISLVTVVIILVAVTIAAIPKTVLTIPHPEKFFGVTLRNKSTDRGDKIYSYDVAGGTDMTDAITAYANLLKYNHDFVISNAYESETGDILIYHLFWNCDSEIETQIYYDRSGVNHKISVRVSGGVGFTNGEQYSEMTEIASLSELDSSKNTQTASASDYTELQERNPENLPDFTDCDSSRSFRFQKAVMDPDTAMLAISYVSNKADVTYALKDYVETLYSMGYLRDDTNDENVYYLYHPKITAPKIDGTKGQIKIYADAYQSTDLCIIRFLLPKEIYIDGYKDRYDDDLAATYRSKLQSSSVSTTSGKTVYTGVASSSSAASTSSSAASHTYNSSTASVSSNTSSYNTGNTVSSRFKVDTEKPDYLKQKRPCNVCNDGDCRKCGGDGYLYSTANDKQNRNCPYCNRGNCRTCGGDGWIE